MTERLALTKNFHQEEWHTPKERAIREVVFGVNDSHITTLGFLAGVTGSMQDHRMILLAALAEIVAGPISMTSAAYISKSYETQLR